jgi:ribonuclease Z
MTIKLTFLGTSDAIPTAKRNHPSILLTYEGENILVDCGEGTQRQFRKAGLNPLRVTRLLITHWHGDHVLGIPGLLETLSSSGYNRTLFVYGPLGTKKFMDELMRAFVFVKNFNLEVKEIQKPENSWKLRIFIWNQKK